MVAVALALSSSLCWGISDFLGGVQARRVSLLRVMLVSESVGLVGLVILIAIRGVGPPALIRLLPAVGAGLAGTVALAGFYRALAIGTMTIVAPISATGVAVPVVVGFLGGERPARVQIAGIVTSVLGVILASSEDGSRRPERGRSAAATGNPAQAKDSRGSVILALLAAIGFGSFFVGLRVSAKADVLWALIASRAASVAVLLLVVAAWSLRAKAVHGGRPWGPLATVGILDVCANGLYALATRHGLLSVVAVVASLYPVATVVLAHLVLGERVRTVQRLGVLAALGGVALIAAG